MTTSSIYDIPLKSLDGSAANFKPFEGKVLLVVNTASKCGLTPQYEGLQKLDSQYSDKGLKVVGFPSNEFMGQEPGSSAEIQDFCSTKYKITFPLFEKTHVKGPEQSELYKVLTSAQPKAVANPGSDFEKKLAGYGQAPKNPSDVLWNFEKFLIDRTGRVVGRFAPDMTPDDPILITAIEKALGAN